MISIQIPNRKQLMFFLLWVAAFIPTGVIGVIAFAIYALIGVMIMMGGQLPLLISVLGMAVMGSLVGVILGLLQYFVIKHYYGLSIENWILATSIGMALAFAVTAFLGESVLSELQWFASAVALSAAQYWVLHRYLHRAWIWVAVHAVGGFLGFVLAPLTAVAWIYLFDNDRKQSTFIQL